MRNPIWFICLLILTFYGCKEVDKVAEDVAKIEVKLDVSRFDREFAEAGPADVPDLKKKYPYLFPATYADSVWVAKVQDSLQVEISREVEKAFPTFEEEGEGLRSLFRHIKYYYPQFSVPRVVTVASDVDYNYRVILADTLLLIGLVNYLGPSHKFYSVIPKYIADDLDKKFLVRDVASAFTKKIVPAPTDRTFLSQMIYYGKELYLKEKLMPLVTDDINIGYTQEQLDWAGANEEQVWRYFVEEGILYDTDSKLGPRFMEPAPFSKFQLELDNVSPDMIGRFIGWQIVRAFMENNREDLHEMLALPGEEIFKRSKYKPRRSG
ncbi:MAG TPA: gliding motility lipoprotein GldB [Arenibacter sp.]|nr:gliding motility lipoprotein GldB [Arenibacter sp.]